jgi:hypothetical protein
MPRRPKGSPPSYRLHKQTNKAIVTLPLGGGRYRDVLLGPYGSPESHAEYARVIDEWRAGRPDRLAAGDLTINELVARFWPQVEADYRDPDGNPTREVGEYRLAFAALVRLYGSKPAARFGPKALQKVRETMVEVGLSRGVVNQRTERIKRLFGWAVAEELVPGTVRHALQAVKGLRKGRSAARETEPVKPVLPERVEAVLPYLTPPVRALVEVLRLSGMRPGEGCVMRRCDIDMSGPIWLYTPARHKNAWRDLTRVITLGPKAQAVVRPFLKPDLDAYLFSPRDAMPAVWEQQRTARKSKAPPVDARARRRKLATLGERYTVITLGQAIARACERAYPPPAELARLACVPGKGGRTRRETDAEWQARLGAQRWTKLLAFQAEHHFAPNQLRHLHLTEVRRRFGLEAAQVAAGHARADVTQVYAERNQSLAERVAAEVG